MLNGSWWTNEANVMSAKAWADGLGTILGLSVAILALILATKVIEKKTRKALEVTIAAFGLLLAAYGYYVSPLLADRISALREAETKATIVTTTKFLREVYEHMSWAERLFQTESIDSAAFRPARRISSFRIKIARRVASSGETAFPVPIAQTGS